MDSLPKNLVISHRRERNGEVYDLIHTEDNIIAVLKVSDNAKNPIYILRSVAMNAEEARVLGQMLIDVSDRVKGKKKGKP